MKTTYLKLMAYNGRIVIANSSEFNELLKDKKCYIMIAPVLFEEKDVQIREIDAEELSTLTPNSMLTSPYAPYFDDVGKKPNRCLNSKPFIVSKLEKAVTELKNLAFLKLFGL